MNRMRILIVLLAVMACSFAIGTYFLFAPVVKDDQGVIYDLQAGRAKSTLIRDLYQQGIISHPWILAMYAYAKKSAQLKTGEYLFPKNANMVSIWRQVTTGTGLYYRSFTIIPGWTFTQLKQMLANTPQLAKTISTMSDAEIMMKLGYPSVSPEGQFMPESYFYTKGNSDLSILKHAFTLMQEKFAVLWAGRSANLPYASSYQALIAASLVEREAFLNAERPIIAGVIVNRLNKNMLLQIDPTVIFGLGANYTGTITRTNLLTDTPYNTYTRKGLPPTPIAMPSVSSIQAVLHPAIHEYIYYVARGDGGHQFSKTLAEHNAAVAAAAAAREKKNHFINQSTLEKYISKSISI